MLVKFRPKKKAEFHLSMENELSKDFYELDALRFQHEKKMEASYEKLHVLKSVKKLNHFEYVLEVKGDYTTAEASLGPIHNIGDTHIARRANKFG